MVENVAGFAYTSGADWERITNNAMTACGEIAREMKDGAIAITEWEHTEKMAVCFRDKGLGTLVFASKPVNRNQAQADWLRPELRRAGTAMAAAVSDAPIAYLRKLIATTPVPVGRGKGAPFWFPGSNRDAAINLASVIEHCKTVDEATTMLKQYGGARLDPHLTSGVRYQSARKPRPNYAVVDGELTAAGEQLRPKARRIAELGWYLNWALIPVSSVMKWARRQVSRRHDGTIARATEIALTEKKSIATDLSTFDETISGETIIAWCECILEPILLVLLRKGLITVLDMKKAIDVVRMCNEMPFLAPSPRTDEAARSVQAYGANKSGIRVTSDIATDVNDARMRTKARDLNLAVSTTNLGDDAIIGSNDEMLARKWFNPRYDNRGFVETLAPALTYLMKYIPGGYAVFARGVAANKDREVRFEPLNVLVSASAIATRRALLRGHPAEHRYYDTVVGMESDPLTEAVAIARATPLPALLRISAASVPPAQTRALEGILRSLSALQDSGLITEAEMAAAAEVSHAISARQNIAYGDLKQIARDRRIDVALKSINRMQSVGT